MFGKVSVFFRRMESSAEVGQDGASVFLLKQVFPLSAETGCLGQAAVSYKLTSGPRDSTYV